MRRLLSVGIWSVFGVGAGGLQWLLGWLAAGFAGDSYNWRTPIENGELLVLALALSVRAFADFAFLSNLAIGWRIIGAAVCAVIVVVTSGGYAVVTSFPNASDAQFTVEVSLKIYPLAIVVSGVAVALAGKVGN